MSLLPSDRLLRKLVAELDGLPSADAKAILASLSPQRRARIDALLAEYRGRAVATPRPMALAPEPEGPQVKPPLHLECLSPWLEMRLNAEAVDSAPHMTTAVREHLRAAALRMGARPVRAQSWPQQIQTWAINLRGAVKRARFAP
jgi:hypothetical protein